MSHFLTQHLFYNSVKATPEVQASKAFLAKLF